MRFDEATLDTIIRKHVVEILYGAADSSYLSGLRVLSDFQDLLPVFSLNHDACLEWALSNAGIPHTTGFTADGFWHPSAFDAMSSGIAIYKLHGSINWSRRLGESFPFCIDTREEILDRLKEPCAVHHTGPGIPYRKVEYDTPKLFFGAKSKFTMEYPFLDFITEFNHRLLFASAVLLIGYGMMDRHINQLLLQGFEVAPKTIIQVNPAPFITGDDDWSPMILAQLGSGRFEWSNLNMALRLGSSMRLVTIRRPLEDRKTWKLVRKEVAKAIRRSNRR